ncbi:MAG: hypothetical protein HY079_13520 [Elusimicrobia bacterium]|nr:hypothetical protein [Elusimicrobiota bacterium]
MRALLLGVLLSVPVAASAQAAAPRLGPSARERALLKKHRGDLEALYRAAEAGALPDGESMGSATGFPGTLVGRIQEDLFGIFWQGKVFDRAQGRLINKILGGKHVQAKVFYGPSWLDGKESVIIDYQDTSALARGIRDEIREVAPGLYLGFAYQRGDHGETPRADILFALDFDRAQWSVLPDPPSAPGN